MVTNYSQTFGSLTMCMQKWMEAINTPCTIHAQKQNSGLKLNHLMKNWTNNCDKCETKNVIYNISRIVRY